MSLYEQGQWRPYERAELLELLTQVMPQTPEYCRLTRVIRDIPSTDIHVGNQETNFREVAEAELAHRGIKLQEIRAREVRGHATSNTKPHLRAIKYQTQVSVEYFINLEDPETEKLLGFCRLSLPMECDGAPQHKYLSSEKSRELSGCAILREVHIYGQSLKINEVSTPAAQHRGFGKQLVRSAAHVAETQGFKKLAVISAKVQQSDVLSVECHEKR